MAAPRLVLINERDANLEMLMAGFAWHYKDYQRERSERDRQLYAAAEDHARSHLRSSGKGLGRP